MDFNEDADEKLIEFINKNNLMKFVDFYEF
jgi:hypothetical protein